MVAIAPFRALRYAPGINLARVTSPPHDCVSPEEREALAGPEARNILHVVLPKEKPGDVEAPATPNKFTRADAALRSWIADGTLQRDAKAAFYHYAVTHGPPDARRTMHGFFARIALDPTYTQIQRHEKTLARRKRERLHLRTATRFDTEPIWLLYRDERGWVEEILASNAFDELARFTDEEGHEHRLWRIDRPQALGEIVAQFEDRHVVIADGHHRYQTALDHAAATGRPEDASIMVCLVRDSDEGTEIWPTHRLVHGLPFNGFDDAMGRLRNWSAQPLALPAGREAATLDAAMAGLGRDVIVVGKRGATLAAVRLRLKPGADVNEGRGRLDGLVVTSVHDRLLRDGWGLDPERPEEHLRFTRIVEEAVQAVASGSSQFAVLLPPEPVSAVLEVAEQGHVMPQKATYFVPKLRSGLVLGPLDEAPPRPWTAIAGDGGRPETRLPRV